MSWGIDHRNRSLLIATPAKVEGEKSSGDGGGDRSREIPGRGWRVEDGPEVDREKGQARQGDGGGGRRRYSVKMGIGNEPD